MMMKMTMTMVVMMMDWYDEAEPLFKRLRSS